MAPFDDYMKKACAPGPDRLIAGCVLAAYKKGVLGWKSFGAQSVDPNLPLSSTPPTLDTTMWIASCTKLMTAIAVLQCVEKGLLNLEDEVSKWLPEWNEKFVLKGFEEGSGKPILEPAKEKLTLRIFLSHQSGIGYPFANEELRRWIEYQQSQGKLPAVPDTDTLHLPLFFEPGTSWNYGLGIDWAGRAVEVSTKQDLNTYMQENIWGPLGMKMTTFHLFTRPDMKAVQADMTKRNDDGSLSPLRGEPMAPHLGDPEVATEAHGGGGVYSCPGDYFEVLLSIIKNDGKLLKPSSVDLLFAPCLSPQAGEKLKSLREDAYRAMEGEDMVIEGPMVIDHSVGGMLCQKDVPGGRKAGTMNWGGLPNLTWVLDRESDTTFFYAGQLVPPGDHKTVQLTRRFEAAVYSGEFFEGAAEIPLRRPQ